METVTLVIKMPESMASLTGDRPYRCSSLVWRLPAILEFILLLSL